MGYSREVTAMNASPFEEAKVPENHLDIQLLSRTDIVMTGKKFFDVQLDTKVNE